MAKRILPRYLVETLITHGTHKVHRAYAKLLRPEENVDGPIDVPDDDELRLLERHLRTLRHKSSETG